MNEISPQPNYIRRWTKVKFARKKNWNNNYYTFARRAHVNGAQSGKKDKKYFILKMRAYPLSILRRTQCRIVKCGSNIWCVRRSHTNSPTRPAFTTTKRKTIIVSHTLSALRLRLYSQLRKTILSTHYSIESRTRLMPNIRKYLVAAKNTASHFSWGQRMEAKAASTSI